MTELRAAYRTGSPLERTLETQLIQAGVTGWVREYRFHPTRRWRFDFAWPAELVAVEIQGATWAQGRHTRGGGYAEDCIKFAEAAVMGWRVMAFTSEQVADGIALRYVEPILGQSVDIGKNRL